MEKYDVHLYAVVRLKVSNVEAESMEEAIDKAGESVDFNDFLSYHNPGEDGPISLRYAEFDEVNSAKVDVVGDENYENTRDFHLDADKWRPGAVPRVLITVSGGVASHVADPGVDVEVFDFDNYEIDPVGTDCVSASFADLAEIVGAPGVSLYDWEASAKAAGITMWFDDDIGKYRWESENEGMAQPGWDTELEAWRNACLANGITPVTV